MYVLVQKKILLGFLIIIAIIVSNGMIGFITVENSLHSIDQDTKSSIADLKSSSRLDDLPILMRYYDEVLTQAARNYAFTSDEKWSKIYYDSEPKLNKIIQEACSISSQKDKAIFDNLDTVNANLVDLEHKALVLTKQGRSPEAIAILESDEYWSAKNSYRQNLIQYSEQKGKDLDQTADVTVEKINTYASRIDDLLWQTQIVLYVGIPILLVVALSLSYFISRSISRPINRLYNTADRVSKGDYDVPFEVKSDDEIGRLGQKFQSMVDSFKNSLETERKLAITQERLKSEKLTAIGELAARIAHDLRNPLSVIKNVSELIRLQYPKEDKRVQDHFTKLENSIQRMSHQIDDVLNFVRTTPLEKKITSVKDIITKSIDDMDIPPGIRLEMPSNDEKIDCDEQKLRTAFSNIILNAIQAVNSNGVISIKITGYTKQILIEISDSGPSIPDDVLLRIFEPLYTTKQQGTGLGLSSCKNIIEQHGGTIYAKNNPTTFVITLPRV